MGQLEGSRKALEVTRRRHFHQQTPRWENRLHGVRRRSLEGRPDLRLHGDGSHRKQLQSGRLASYVCNRELSILMPYANVATTTYVNHLACWPCRIQQNFPGGRAVLIEIGSGRAGFRWSLSIIQWISIRPHVVSGLAVHCNVFSWSGSVGPSVHCSTGAGKEAPVPRSVLDRNTAGRRPHLTDPPGSAMGPKGSVLLLAVGRRMKGED